jgi:NTE family protein
VNPVPVTAARALGADVVVCVNLNGDMRSRGTVIQGHGADGADELLEAAAEVAVDEPRRWGFWPGRGSGRAAAERVRKGRPPGGPGIASVMIDAFNITQDRISRSRLAGDPPDVMINPRLGPIGLFEFHKAAECIELGRQAAIRALPEIEDVLGGLGADAKAG